MTTTKRIRILHVIGGLGAGGAETILFKLATNSHSFEHHVISLSPAGWYSASLQSAGVGVDHLDVRGVLSGLRSLPSLVRLIRRSEADVVQAWMYRSNLLASGIAKALGIPSVWGIHCSSLKPLNYRARLWVFLSGLGARWLPSFIINCSERSAVLHRRLGFGFAPGSVIHNGYESDVFFPDANSRHRFRSALGISPGTFVIGCVGRWHPQKDHETLLRSFKIIAEQDPELCCLLVGPGMESENPELHSLIRRFALEDRIILLGTRRDIPEVMRSIDLHVLASCGGEAFPNVVAEAMLSTTPCAVTDVGDAAFMVGETGWVAPAEEPIAMARHIREALDDFRHHPTEWRERGVAARERIASSFALRLMIDRYEAVWSSLVKEQDSGGAKDGS